MMVPKAKAMKVEVVAILHHRYPHACAIQSLCPESQRGTGNDVAWQSKHCFMGILGFPYGDHCYRTLPVTLVEKHRRRTAYRSVSHLEGHRAVWVGYHLVCITPCTVLNPSNSSSHPSRCRTWSFEPPLQALPSAEDHMQSRQRATRSGTVSAPGPRRRNARDE
jgi:hypothetical protein